MDLNLFAEAAFVLDQYPQVSPDAVLSMITIGGAEALGRGDLLGSIERGKKPALLAIPLPHPVTVDAVVETVIYRGQEGALEWVHSPGTC
jgi:cytosine/adenosine deaminase-related metal-dependent hydrolase